MMLRTGTVLRCIRPIQRHFPSKRSLPIFRCTSFHTAIAIRQGNEPHGLAVDELPKAPIINPADKYKEDGERLHEYGTYILTCLPKFIQKFRHPLDHISIL
jgi:hypothetical protein